MIFAVVTCATLATAAYAPLMRYVRWKEARRDFAKWTSRTDLGDGKIHTYAMLNRGLDSTEPNSSPSRQPFLISNAEMRLVTQSNGETMILFDPIGKPPNPDRFYILPAKTWVDDIDSVIDAWDRWRDTEFRNGG